MYHIKDLYTFVLFDVVSRSFDDAKVWKVAIATKYLGYSALNCDE
jgi:hypothetical protein